MSIAHKLAAVFGGLVVLTACGNSPEGFVNSYAKLSCQSYEKCTRASFVEAYDDQGECREEIEEFIEDLDLVDDCDFNEDEAKDCLDSLRDYKSSCDPDDYEYDDCAEVFDDC